jgi:hypothetical protein
MRGDHGVQGSNRTARALERRSDFTIGFLYHSIERKDFHGVEKLFDDHSNARRRSLDDTEAEFECGDDADRNLVSLGGPHPFDDVRRTTP